MEESFGLDEVTAPRADPEEGAVGAVHADGTGRALVHHRLPVDEGTRRDRRQPGLRHDPERRVDLLGFGRLWMSLAEPREIELRGAYELPRAAIG